MRAKPSEHSNPDEILKLFFLHCQNLGSEAPATKAAQLGIFSHHGNTPHGIRLAVEHAMREELIRFVICTSTLAQGVNLPIRYLIVTSVYQGLDRIKVRDFHNLIGRAGRAGMHTEGSVLFADPIVYDKRKSIKDRWRWKQVKEILEPVNSEPCISNLLSLFEPIKSDDGKFRIVMEAMDFPNYYLRNPDNISEYSQAIATKHADKNFTKNGVDRQVSWKISLISSIESFLVSHWDMNGEETTVQRITNLAKETFAYFLADETEQEYILNLFKLLAENISLNITEPQRREIYGKTLYGMRDAQEIHSWVQANIGYLLLAKTDDEILNIIWPILAKHVKNSVFNKCDKPAVLQGIARQWIQGEPFHELFDTLENEGAQRIWGTKRRKFKIDHVVEICESGLAYDGTLLIGAVIELTELIYPNKAIELINNLKRLQKRLKYGLPCSLTISLYELGFANRVVTIDLGTAINVSPAYKQTVIRAIKRNEQVIRRKIEKYPSYFSERLNDLIQN